MTIEQRWAAAERTLDVQAARRIRRTPAVVIGITALLVLAVALTAAVDLRRLQTPRGAALAWTEAAVFGNCRAFVELSTSTADRRSDDQICRALRSKTEQARRESGRYDVRAVSVTQTGRHATAVVEVRTPGGTSRVTEELVRSRHTWRVVRPPGACEVSCY